MKLFELPLRGGQTFGYDQGPLSAFTQVLDARGDLVATTFGTDAEHAEARASWFVLHANARFAQLVPADNELDEQAYDRARDEVRDE